MMPLALGHRTILDPPEDGRQSETARQVAQGVRRMLRAMKLASVAELVLSDGRRADLMALASDGSLTIVEIKSSVGDLRADAKWPFYRNHCDQLYFAIPASVPPERVPADAGLIVADAYDAAILRAAPVHRLAPATRRAVLIRFAQAAADRLHAVSDPAGRF